MVTMLALGAFLKPLPKVGGHRFMIFEKFNKKIEPKAKANSRHKLVNNAFWFCQSVLGALIAVNLKNTLLQLSDPYYLWKKSKLDCVSQSIGGNIAWQCDAFLFFLIFLSLPVCVGCVILGHILSQLALRSSYRSGIFRPGSYIQDTVVSKF